MNATFRRSVTKIAAILAGGMRCAVWKRRQNAGGERVRERSFAPPDGRGRPSLRDFWWSHSFVPPWFLESRCWVLMVGGAENAICVLTLSWVGGCGARGRDRSSREVGGRNAHREWRSHSPNA